jgi:uncharacterized protein
MELSKFNIISPVKNSELCLILNPLYGKADIIDTKSLACLQGDGEINEGLPETCYFVDPEKEKSEFRKAYLQFLEERDTDELQLFFVPWYQCNFGCSYCYQGNYDVKAPFLKKEVIDAFFDYVDSEFKGRSKYITIFGGEPLLPGKLHMARVRRLIESANKRGVDIAVVTNGYHVPDYIEILRHAQIREVQVTIDGTEEVHDKRRFLKGGQGTFARIVSGIDLLLDNEIPVNLRVVTDRENISELPKLASFAIARGWTRSALFKTQVGRNYELHECMNGSDKLFSRIELHQEIYELIRLHPHILDFHKPSFSVARHLSENGELPPPLFDACPGTKTEWAFDYTGSIYACTATAGKEGEELGKFYPDRVHDDNLIEEWADRDILSINECRDCNLSLLCGGGCAAIAKNQTGNGKNPDCRPVRELLELGIATYFQVALNKHHVK